MKDGSLQRLPEPVLDEVALSRRDGSSWSKVGGGEEGAEGAEGEEEAAFDDKGEAEATACGEGEGEGEGRTAALEVGELGVCLVGRWVAEGFL